MDYTCIQNCRFSYLINDLIFAISYGIACLLGTPGNILAIWITGFKIKTKNAVWLLHLAIADLICCVFLSCLSVSCFLHYFSSYPCLIHYLYVTGYIAVFLSACASITFLTAMSMDRCVSIMCPLWYKTHSTSKFVHIRAAIIWIFSLILLGLELYFKIIHLHSKPPHEYVIITLLSVSFTIIIICYTLICFKVKNAKRPKKSQRPYRVITALVICFFCCWAPFYIFHLISDHLPWNINKTIYTISYILVCVNSCIDPIIYVFIGQDFKETLMASLPHLFKKKVINKCCNQTPRKLECDNEEILNQNVENK